MIARCERAIGRRLAVPSCCSALLLLAAVGTGKQEAQAGRQYPVRKLHPVDEAGKDLSFLAFRRTMFRIVRDRDRRALEGALAPDVVSSFGRSPGRKDFVEEYHPERKDSKVWSILSRVLPLGGSFSTVDGRRTFSAPYVFSKFPEDLDSESYGVVLRPKVEVRAAPAVRSRVIAILSYDIVKWDGTPDLEQVWTLILTPQGLRGYVPTRHIRSPMDYRAMFSKIRGRWLITSLVSGD